MKALGTGLKSNKHLKYLNLSNNYIEDEGFEYLTEEMCDNSTLRVLDLSNNSLKQENSENFERLVS